MNGLPRFRQNTVLLIGIALATLLHLALRLNFIDEPLERDEGFYATVAVNLLDGGVPYRDAIDIKPPGIALIYAAMIKLGGEQLASIRVGSALYSALTLIALATVASAAAGKRTGLIAAYLFAIFGATPFLTANSANTEVFLGLPLLLWLWGILHCRQLALAPVMAGTGIALALLIKPVVLPFALFGLLPVALHRAAGRSVVRSVGLYVAPGVVLLALVGAWFAAQGAWPEFWHWNVEVPFSYATGSFMNGPPLTQSLALYADLLFPMAGLAIPWAAYAFWRQRMRLDHPATLIAASLACAILAFLLPGKNFVHYYIVIVPFACLATALALDAATALPPLARYLLLAGWVLAFGNFVYRSVPWHVGASGNDVSVKKYNSDLFVKVRALGEELGRLTRPEERIFQWGFEPQIYFYSQRRPASRYIGNVLLAMDDKGVKSTAILRRELAEKRPRFIVIVEGTMNLIGYSTLLSYLGAEGYEHYSDVAYFEGPRQYRIGVFRRP